MDWTKLATECKNNPIRSTTLIAVAPKGSTGILHNTASGIHPDMDMLSSMYNPIADESYDALLEMKK